MSDDGYSAIAEVYDKLNKDIDYAAWADMIDECFARFGNQKPEIVLDLACGTGRMTRELAARGYDMIGIDGSYDMLGEAYSGGTEGILYLCQDMREFELYGTVDLAVSCLDSINHLQSPADLATCLDLVHNYLVPDGLFVFDVNGRYKFENVYADNAYTMEEDGSFCVWQNSYNPKSHLCDFYITVFSEDEDGRYTRYEDMDRERMYTLRSLKSALLRNGFEFIGAYSDFEFTEADDNSERIYIVARCKK